MMMLPRLWPPRLLGLLVVPLQVVGLSFDVLHNTQQQLDGDGDAFFLYERQHDNVDVLGRRLQLQVDEVITQNSAYTATSATYLMQQYAGDDATQLVLQISPDIGVGQGVSCTVSCTSIDMLGSGILNMKYGDVLTDIVTDTSSSQVIGNAPTTAQPSCPYSISEYTNPFVTAQTMYVGVGVRLGEGTLMRDTSVTCTASPPPTPAPTPAPTESGTPAPTPTADSITPPPTCACFSETATVKVKPPSIAPSIMPPKPVLMKDLKVGQQVFAGYKEDKEQEDTTTTTIRAQKKTPIYETVYGFGHRNETKENEYLRISLEDTIEEQPIEISGAHLIFVHDKKDPVRADSLKVGDYLVFKSSLDDNNGVNNFTTINTTNNNRASSRRITSIESIVAKGVYEPLTKDGTILVDGVEASTYVSIRELAPRLVELGGHVFSDQQGAHWFVAPYRFVCTKVAPQLCVNDYSLEEEGINHWLAFGKNCIVRYGEDLPTWLMAIYLFVAMSIFGIFLFVDNLLEGDAWSISTVVSGIALLLFWLWSSQSHRKGSKAKVE